MEKSQVGAFPYDINKEHVGLTVREYFAIKCLPVFIKNNINTHENSYDENAKKAVKLEDALISALKEKKSDV